MTLTVAEQSADILSNIVECVPGNELRVGDVATLESRELHCIAEEVARLLYMAQNLF